VRFDWYQPRMTDVRDHALDSSRRRGPEERAYLLERAETHRALAMQAADPETRAVHSSLHQLYAQRAGEADGVDPR